MRKSYFSILLILFASSITLLFGKSDEIDSLLQVLENTHGKQQVSTYNQLAKLHYYEDPHKAIEYGEISLNLAVDNGYDEEQFFALIHIGVGYSI